VFSEFFFICAVQINVARQQVNQVNMAESPRVSIPAHVGHAGGVGPPRAELDLGTSNSGGSPAPGIANATKHAEQTDPEKHQARRLGDDSAIDIDGDDAGSAGRAEVLPREWQVGVSGAAAPRDIDPADVAGESTRPSLDEHLATAATAAADGGDAAAPLSAQDTQERHGIAMQEDTTATTTAGAVAGAAVCQDAAADCDPTDSADLNRTSAATASGWGPAILASSAAPSWSEIAKLP